MFINNPFAYTCPVCDRLWFKNDLKFIENNEILEKIIKVKKIMNILNLILK